MTRDRLKQIAVAFLFAGVVYAMVFGGLKLRRWTWTQTESIRYGADMDNAWRWGSTAAKDGYFKLYDRVLADHVGGHYGLDYVPLRLGVMTLWARWVEKHDPGATGWKSTYEFNAPLLRFNTAMELSAAVGMFFLVRYWLRKEKQSPPPSVWGNRVRRWFGRPTIEPIAATVEPTPMRFCDGHWLALLAAALVWLNASSIFSAHGRPTWDVWVIPFYVWAVYFASRNNWFIAGLLVGVGAMLKGQQMIAAPFFVLWPLCSLRFGAIGRWLLGVTLAAGLIVSPWQVWLTPQWGPLLICIAGLLLGPAVWLIVWAIRPIRRFAKVRPAIWLSGAGLAIGLWASPALFQTSTAWFKIGYVYGIDKMPDLESGGTSSIAGLMQHRYGWESTSPANVPFTHYQVPVKYVLVTVAYVLIALSAIAAAWHGARHDRRFLLAAAAPWLIYFALFPQMHERYLLWASLMTSCAVCFSVGLTGLCLILTAFSWIMGINQMLRDGDPERFATGISPTFGQSLRAFCNGTIPDSAWAIALVCLIWMWLMFTHRPGRTLRCRHSSAKIAPVE